MCPMAVSHNASMLEEDPSTPLPYLEYRWWITSLRTFLNENHACISHCVDINLVPNDLRTPTSWTCSRMWQIMMNLATINCCRLFLHVTTTDSELPWLNPRTCITLSTQSVSNWHHEMATIVPTMVDCSWTDRRIAQIGKMDYPGTQTEVTETQY
mmetsp:Transcript_28118/g.56209  ORF Transcript_28118/g.56209 Transcript_28118/m.56209 type:complete len:155 (+) Transcript_28118:67-531(+)